MSVNNNIVSHTPDVRPLVSNNADKSKKAEEFFGDDGFNFGDILDAINPLKHIPIVSDIYEKATEGGEISDPVSPASKLIGGALFGGVIGFIASFVNNVFETSTGKSITEHALSVFDDDPDDVAPTALASIEQEKDTIPAPLPSPPAESLAFSSATKKYEQSIKDLELITRDQHLENKKQIITSLVI